MRKTSMALAIAALVLAGPLVGGTAQAADSKKAATPIEITPPPAGKGQIVFFRPSGAGVLLGCTVREGEQEVSRLGNGKYFVHVTEPGPHEYAVQSEAKDVLNLEVEPDETQYVRCKISMGIMVGRPNLSPATQGDFDEKSSKLKLQQVKEEKEAAKATS